MKTYGPPPDDDQGRTETTCPLVRVAHPFGRLTAQHSTVSRVRRTPGNPEQTMPEIAALAVHAWTPLDDRTALAIHEAAHAVVAVRFALPIVRVTLNARTRDHQGHVVLRDSAVARPIWDLMAFSAAGPIAEDIARGGRDRRGGTWRGAADLEYLHGDAVLVQDAFREGRPERGLPQTASVQQIAETAWAHAYRLVIDNWGAIVAVSAALLNARRALTGAKVRAIADSAASVTPLPTAHLAETFWPPQYTGRMWAERTGGAR